MQQLTRFSILVWISLVIIHLNGCANSNSKEKIFGDPLPTMKTIYQQTLHRPLATDKQQVQRRIHTNTGDLSDNQKSIYMGLRQQFPLLPNPTLMLYVYPHLTAAGTPIPGYYTLLPFYTQAQSALPGEIIAPIRPNMDK